MDSKFDLDHTMAIRAGKSVLTIFAREPNAVPARFIERDDNFGSDQQNSEKCRVP
jgi:hypothetical protein